MAVRQALNAVTGNKSIIPIATGAVFGYMDYADSRDQGNGVIQSLASAGLNAVLPELMGTGLYIGGQLASAAIEAAPAIYENLQMQKRQMDRTIRNQTPFQNYTFVDSPQIYTMRQAGMALAKQSKFKLQQAMMGNEAQYLHR